MTLFASTLVRAPHVRSFEIQADAGMWYAVERQDEQLVQRTLCSDWHRVERTIARFNTRIAALHRDGWREHKS